MRIARVGGQEGIEGGGGEGGEEEVGRLVVREGEGRVREGGRAEVLAFGIAVDVGIDQTTSKQGKKVGSEEGKRSFRFGLQSGLTDSAESREGPSLLTCCYCRF